MSCVRALTGILPKSMQSTHAAFHINAVPLQPNALRASPLTMGSTTDFKTGLTIEFEGAVWKVTEFLHVKPGKGPAFVRSKLKNLETGNTLEKTWKAGETFPDAQVDKASMLFSYTDGEDHVFMNMETFEEERIKSASVRTLTANERPRLCVCSSLLMYLFVLANVTFCLHTVRSIRLSS